MADSSRRSGGISGFFGGSPGVVLVKLILLSVVIGVIMAALGLDAFAILRSLERMVVGLFDNFWDAGRTVLRWFLLGAVIVFPVWLVLRIMSMGKR